MSEDTVKGSKTARSVRGNGHTTSGGHSFKATARGILKQNSALSRVNRTRWDWSDGSPGDSMTFQYQEYPKYVYNDPHNSRSFVIVNSVDEERLAVGGEEIIREEDERDRLLALASVSGVQVDKRWGPAKITKAIEDAGFDPTSNPFE